MADNNTKVKDPEIADRHADNIPLPESVFVDTKPDETQEEGARRRISAYEKAQMKAFRASKK